MKYLGFRVTRDGVKHTNKKRSNNQYEDTYFPKRSTEVYRCSKLIPQYVAKAVTYVSNFN